MNKRSLMLRRIRRGYSKGLGKIPRKGRIRVILALGIIAVAVLVLKNRGGRSGGDSLDTPPPSDSATGKHAAAPSAETDDKTVLRAPRSVGKAEMKHEDVVELLRRFPPRLSRTRDTLEFSKHPVVIHYALDTALQALGRKLFKRYHPKYAAAVAITPADGRVVGLMSYTRDDVRELEGNLACRTLFPAASIFKTVTAAAAVERGGLAPDTPLKHVGRNHTLYNFQLEKDLENFTEISLRKAYAYSINPVFGRIGIFRVGCRLLKEYGARFGFLCNIPFDLETEISSLNSCDSSFALAELASGFNTGTTLSPLLGALLACAICDNGIIQRPVLVDSITDAGNRKTRYQARPTPWKSAVSPATAEALRDLMRSVARFGTARSAFKYVKRSYRFKNIEYGGKTGSVNKDGLGKVDWFTGFARHPSDTAQRLAVAVVTVHGAYWTVHSSFLGAEIIRHRLRNIQIAREKKQAVVDSLKRAETDSAESG